MLTCKHIHTRTHAHTHVLILTHLLPSAHDARRVKALLSTNSAEQQLA